MSTQDSTASYIETSGQAYRLLIDGLASLNRSRLEYWKSVWGIVSRPYPSTALDSAVRETLDRANEFTDLTATELRERVRITADFSEKFLAQVEKLQDASVEVLRDSLKTYASTVSRLQEAASEAASEISARADKHAEKARSLVSASN